MGWGPRGGACMCPVPYTRPSHTTTAAAGSLLMMLPPAASSCLLLPPAACCCCLCCHPPGSRGATLSSRDPPGRQATPCASPSRGISIPGPSPAGTRRPRSSASRAATWPGCGGWGGARRRRQGRLRAGRTSRSPSSPATAMTMAMTTAYGNGPATRQGQTVMALRRGKGNNY